MKFARQHRLPFADARSQTAAILPTSKAKRWSLDGVGDRAVHRADDLAPDDLAPDHLGPDHLAPLVLDTAPGRGPSKSRAVEGTVSQIDADAANAFAAKRIRHSIELIGSCMLMAAIVVLALFA